MSQLTNCETANNGETSPLPIAAIVAEDPPVPVQRAYSG